MIKNERQFAVTKSQVKTLEKALKTAAKSHNSLNPKIYLAMIKGMKEQIRELRKDISEYEKLKKSPSVKFTSIDELPTALIKARVAKHLRQEDLALMLHLKPQQIQKYEMEDYRGASFERLAQIAKVLGIAVHGELAVKK